MSATPSIPRSDTSFHPHLQEIACLVRESLQSLSAKHARDCTLGPRSLRVCDGSSSQSPAESAATISSPLDVRRRIPRALRPKLRRTKRWAGEWETVSIASSLQRVEGDVPADSISHKMRPQQCPVVYL